MAAARCRVHPTSQEEPGDEAGGFASYSVETTRREDVCDVLDVPYDPDHWNDWRWQMRHRLTRLEQFDKLLHLTESERRGLMLASEKFSVAVTPSGRR